MRFLTLCSTLALTPVAVFAAPPQVATDIAPVHSLVAQVMGDLGTPDLILPPGASPHGYAMRPSEAAAIANADLVVWIGETLTPWLERPIANLGGDAVHLELLGAGGSTVFEGREDAVFEVNDEDHDHGHDDHGHDDDHAGEEKAHDDHDDHAHDDHGHDAHAHDEHDHEEKAHDHDEHAGHDHDDKTHDDHAGHDHGDHHGHDHGGTDPHAWLDPANASIWLGEIATALSAIDPENAATYAANAAAGQANMGVLIDEITAQLAPISGRPHVVFHDAYQYFEARFDTTPLGAISISDASSPSAARLSALRAALSEAGVVCVFSEPQFDPRLAAAVTEGTEARSAVLDPLGVDIPLGAGFYRTLIRAMATAKSDCLSDI